MRTSYCKVYDLQVIGLLSSDNRDHFIRYMKDSVVEERGTHTELMALGKGYAHVYSLQAKAFLSW